MTGPLHPKRSSVTSRHDIFSCQHQGLLLFATMLSPTSDTGDLTISPPDSDTSPCAAAASSESVTAYAIQRTGDEHHIPHNRQQEMPLAYFLGLLDEAIASHQAWVTTFEQALQTQGSLTIDYEQVASVHTCRLGTILTCSDIVTRIPARMLEHIQHEHAMFHYAAQTLLDATRIHNPPQTIHNHLHSLREVSTVLIRHLQHAKTVIMSA